MTKSACDPKEIALKSFFLGPQAENAAWVSDLVQTIFSRWAQWRRTLHPSDGRAISEENARTPEFLSRKNAFERVALDLLGRFEDEVPKFSPRYVGHMFSEISLPALIGHLITLLHNPNNISGESSKVGIRIESEAIHFLLRMTGYSPEEGTGHFTSGGTVANFEAFARAHARTSLWLSVGAWLASNDRAVSFDPFAAAHRGWEGFDEAIQQAESKGMRAEELLAWNLERTNPHLVCKRIEQLTSEEFLGPVVLVPENKHYSWKKGCRIFGLGDDAIWPVELDANGRLSLTSLEKEIERARSLHRPILFVVSVAGTTELGTIDPVDEVQDLLDRYRSKEQLHIWHHVDAAYGGFFRTLDLPAATCLSEKSVRALSAFSRSTSITLDPHKLGYVPYASGTFLTREKRDYYFSLVESAPYLDFDVGVDRGPYTIEGSRSAAGAVATWMTAQTMGFDEKGYGLLLERTIRIRKSLQEKLERSGLGIRVAPGCDTNIIGFSCARTGENLSRSNERTLRVYEKFSTKANGDFIVSKTALAFKSHDEYLRKWTGGWDGKRDADEVVLIRMCLMNPFFESIEMTADYAGLFIEALGEVLRSESNK